MSVVFFHQNEVTGAQGGVERYVATLLDEAGEQGLLITGARPDGPSITQQRRISVPLPMQGRVPRWLSYVMGVAWAARRIRKVIRRAGPCSLEFSRPEYVLVAWLFRGAKVFTLHGTGPARNEGLKYWLHYASCVMLPLFADVVQIVGRDKRGLPPRICGLMAGRLRCIDAWYDDAFRVAPFHDRGSPMRIFFAGRLAPMKNPDLLFKIIETASCKFESRFEFRYFGADGGKIPERLLSRVSCAGLLNVQEMADAITDCDIGILCSGYGEGSPFIVVEALASGRGFVLPPLPSLIDAYQGHAGIVFATAYTVDAFIEAIHKMERAIKTDLSPETIANGVSSRSKHDAARRILRRLELDHG